MEIVVEGIGKKEVLPDLVKININFKFIEKTYDKSLELGTKSVTEFVNNVLPKLDIKKEEFKTTKFSIEHKLETDYRTDKEKDLGYEFVQRTGVDSLAIAIGTSHGAYKFKGDAKLRFDILQKIK